MFARRDRVGLAAYQPEGARHARLDGEVVHLIVHNDACPGKDDLGAERRIDCSSAGDPVAFLVGDGEVRGVLFENIRWRIRRLAVRGDLDRMIDIDHFSQLRRVLLANQTAQNWRKGGIAQPKARSANASFIASGMTCNRVASSIFARSKFSRMFKISST